MLRLSGSEVQGPLVIVKRATFSCSSGEEGSDTFYCRFRSVHSQQCQTGSRPPAVSSGTFWMVNGTSGTSWLLPVWSNDNNATPTLNVGPTSLGIHHFCREKPSWRAKVTLLQREIPVGNPFDFDSLRRESSNLPHSGWKIREVVFLHKNDVVEFEKKFRRFQIHDATIRKTAVRRRAKVDRPHVVSFTKQTEGVEVVASSLHSPNHSIPPCTKHTFQAPNAQRRRTGDHFSELTGKSTKTNCDS